MSQFLVTTEDRATGKQSQLVLSRTGMTDAECVEQIRADHKSTGQPTRYAIVSVLRTAGEYGNSLPLKEPVEVYAGTPLATPPAAPAADAKHE